MKFPHSLIPSLVLCLFSLVLSGQVQQSAAAIRQQAEDNALLIPEINNCCGIGDDFFMQINFGANEARWEACSPVLVETLLFYPTDGAVNGSAEICVDLPALNTTTGNFRIVDYGDFAEVPGNAQQICAVVNYPVVGFTDVDPGFVKKRFIAVPERGSPDAVPAVTIQGTLTIGANECQCDAPIQFGFSSVTSPIFPGAVGAYFLESGENLSDLLASPCAFNCLPDGSAVNNVGNVLVFGELNIDQDYSFGEGNNPLKSTITLGPDAKINVKDGATLTLIDTEVSGCFEMWNAITVEDGGELVVLQGRNRSLITGGVSGVVVHDGGKATLEGVDFEANKVSVSTLDDGLEKAPEINVFGCNFSFGEGPDVERIIPGPFLGLPFLGEVPRAGIELFDVRDGFLLARGTETAVRNNFENLENGIVFNNSIGYVTSASFNWMKSTENEESGNGVLIKQDVWYRNRNYIQSNLNIPQGQGLVTFRNSERGINAIDPYSLYVRYVNFENVDYGIYSENANYLKVYDNSFDSNQSGVTALENWAASVRIRDNNFYARKKSEKSNAIRLAYTTGRFSRRAEVRDNVITLAGASIGVDATNPMVLDLRDNEFQWEILQDASITAVAVEGGSITRARGNLITGNNLAGTTGFFFNTSSSVDLRCNRVENIDVGILFEGNNGRSKIRGNIMEDSQVGLQVGQDPNSGVFDVIGRQEHNGNQWLGAFGDVGAKYKSNEANIRFSEFIVDDDGPGFIPASWSPDEFFRLTLGATDAFYSCPTGLPPGGNLVDDDEGYIKSLLNHQVSWTNKLGAAKWVANTQALKAFDRGELTESKVTGITNWANAPTLNAERNAVFTEGAVVAALSPPALDDDLVDEQTEKLDDAYLAYVQAQVESERAALLGVPYSGNDLQVLAQELTVAEVGLLQLINTPGHSKPQALTTARSLNSTLGTAEVHEANEKQVNDYVLTLAELGKLALKNDLPAILAIAEQCPDLGGTAVFRARALAALLGSDLVYDDSKACAEIMGIPGKKLVPITSGTAHVFPNPTNSQITVNAGAVAILSLKLTDIFGRVVYEMTSNPKAQITQLQIDVSPFKAGLYVVVLQLADGISVSRKITIQ